MSNSKAKSVPCETNLNNERLDRDNTTEYSSDPRDSIPSLPFCTKTRLLKPTLQLIGKFGKDCGLYLIIKAADNDGFEKSLHHSKSGMVQQNDAYIL